MQLGFKPARPVDQHTRLCQTRNKQVLNGLRQANRIAAGRPDLLELESALEPSPQQIRPDFRVRPLKRYINWFKWEGLWFERWQHQQQAPGSGPTQQAASSSPTEDPYFQRYSSPAAHQPYLEDTAAMETYRRAILGNSELFKGKVVLDVGCGLGLTAMMAAKAGAAHVYAVDASAAAEQAAKVVAANGLQGQVTVIKGRVEKVDLPAKQVDIIISNFMGPFLLAGGMLPAVLQARDRWLAPNGLMFPDRADLLLQAINDGEYLAAEKKFWSSIYGFDMSCVLPAAIKHTRQDTLARKALAVTPPARVLSLDLYQTSAAEAAGFSKGFRLSCAREEGRVSGLLGYFEVAFAGRGKVLEPEVLRTGPAADETHWRQTIFSFPRGLRLAKGDVLAGKVSCRQSSSSSGSGSSDTSSRDLLVDVEIEFQGAAARQVYVVKDGSC